MDGRVNSVPVCVCVCFSKVYLKCTSITRKKITFRKGYGILENCTVVVEMCTVCELWSWESHPRGDKASVGISVG